MSEKSSPYRLASTGIVGKTVASGVTPDSPGFGSKATWVAVACVPTLAGATTGGIWGAVKSKQGRPPTATDVGIVANLPLAAYTSGAGGVSSLWFWAGALGFGVAGAHLGKLAGLKSPAALGAAAGATWTAADILIAMALLKGQE